MTDQLVKGASHYAEAMCILPACGQPLHLIWSGSRPVYLSDTADMLRDPASATTTTWRVECEAGHVVLLPADTAGDYYEFAGRCTCNDDYPDPDNEALCSHNDMDRLRAVALPEPAPREG